MKLSTFLAEQANKLRQESMEYSAVEMLKSAGMKEDEARAEVVQALMEKEATSHLVEAGIDYDEALRMVKLAGIKVKDLDNFKAEPSFEEMLAATFEKAAGLAEELEVKANDVDKALEKVAELETILAEKPETVEVPEVITKFAQSGSFTNADLEALMKLPTETLTKVASHNDEPWKMGKSAAVSSKSLDPLTEFLIS